jgi:hypothetical protein
MSTNETKLQVKCLIGDEGHIWIKDYDALPPVVRQRLRNSPFNLCAACLMMFVLPEVQRKHPNYTDNKAIFAAIEIMEIEVRKEDYRSSHPLTKGKVKVAAEKRGVK